MDDSLGQTLLPATERGLGPFADAIDAELELGAYETLWCEPNASFSSIAQKFRRYPGARPSDFVPADVSRETGQRVIIKLRERLDAWFGLRLHGEIDYPFRLRDASTPVEMLYFQGWWDLVETPSVAVVGTRNPSEQGRKRTRKMVQALLEDGFTIVSGLAKGIDTVSQETAIAEGGKTIGVIGTPLGNYYPKFNENLQRRIAAKFLLISQIPVERYEAQNPTTNRFFFPERNKTMSALSQATIIIESGETSGTLTQAREAIYQGRKLFILDSCFRNPKLTWPAKFEAKGAIRVREYDDVRSELVDHNASDRGHGKTRSHVSGA